MTKLLAVLGQPDQPGDLTLRREDDFWLVGFGDAVTRVPDSLGLHYLDLLVRHPGRDLTAPDLVQLTAARPGPTARPPPTACTTRREPAPARSWTRRPGPPAGSASPISTRMAEAGAWHDTERASRLRAEKDFLVRERAAATGLGGRPRRPGAESERARLNVTRAIRPAIARIRDCAPAAAAHLDQSVRTGTRCSYAPSRR
jgi:hypothetical protein